MANENKKAHELASESDEDTSELEILSDTLVRTPEQDYEFESDAATHSFENLDRRRQSESFAALTSELEERDATIGRLEYELEQHRARLSGLETEIAAREAAFTNLAKELGEAREALAVARERVQRRDEKLARLEEQLREQSARLADTEGALAEALRAAASSESAQSELEASWQDAERRIAALAADLEHEREELQRARQREQAEAQRHAERDKAEAQRRAELEQQHAETRSFVETLRQYIDGRKTQWDQQDVLLRTKDALLDEQHRQLEQFASEVDEQQQRLHEVQAEAIELRARKAVLEEEVARLAAEVAAVSGDAEEQARARAAHRDLQARYAALSEHAEILRAEVEALRAGADGAGELAAEHERLTGALAAQRVELRATREQLERTECYADELRRQIGELSAEAEASATAHSDLAHAFDALRTRSDELVQALEAERASRAELEAGEAGKRRQLEEEIERLRLDLTRAEQTLGENQTLNEQLTAELIETSSFRVALESQLAQSDESYRKQVQALGRDAKKLRQQLEDYQRKLASKDAAIGVLLAELASKPGAAPEENLVEPVVHLLPERKPQASEERPPAQDKERVARLLVGTLDGQEVRFPLFKNKLTIGRTAHNDIQLKAQYVSRRHAVIVCDHDSTRIVDWGSKNGIYVNGLRVAEKILAQGDRVTVGTAEFRYEELPKR
ncbi:MAG TPA: FHA domain-containing protein [Woeseiaceae bacterium]